MARSPKFDGIYCDGYVTFKSALTRGTDENKVCKISAAGTVALCNANDQFYGVVKVISANDKAASVQEHGYVTVTGTGISVGYQPLVADGSGGVKLVASPAVGNKYYHVVDLTSTTVTFKLD